MNRLARRERRSRAHSKMRRKSSSRSPVPRAVRRRNTTPAPTSRSRPSSPRFPIVGIGASAGGLEAFTQLLRALPNDTGMAFVFVQHLDPAHETVLTELLSRATRMPTSQVEDGTPEQGGRVPALALTAYVRPEDRERALAAGYNRHLVKPIDPIDLASAVAQLAARA